MRIFKRNASGYEDVINEALEDGDVLLARDFLKELCGLRDQAKQTLTMAQRGGGIRGPQKIIRKGVMTDKERLVMLEEKHAFVVDQVGTCYQLFKRRKIRLT